MRMTKWENSTTVHRYRSKASQHLEIHCPFWLCCLWCFSHRTQHRKSTVKNISQVFIIFKPLPFEEHSRRRNSGRTVSGRLLTEKGDPGEVVYDFMSWGQEKTHPWERFLRNSRRTEEFVGLLSWCFAGVSKAAQITYTVGHWHSLC